MTDQENNNSQTSSAMPVIIAVLAVLGVIIIAGLYASNQKVQSAEQQNTAVADAPAAPNSENIVINEETSATPPPTTINPTVSRADDSPYSARIIGDPNAPLKISEHSSFTCGGCKHFHESNYIKIKKDYINTGKAYVVFNDLPRNYIDMHIGSIARCLPDNVYFNFTQLMFETQDQWADPKKYVSYMKQNTQLLGLSEEKFEECLNSEEIQKIITDVQEAAHETHGVKSTPTLVLNDSVVVLGLAPYEDLKKTFDSLIAAAEEEKPSEEMPEATPEEIQEETAEEPKE